MISIVNSKENLWRDYTICVVPLGIKFDNMVHSSRVHHGRNPCDKAETWNDGHNCGVAGSCKSLDTTVVL